MATRTISVLGGNWSALTAWTEGAVPLASDDVVATALSASLVVTAASVCRSINLTNYVATLSGSGDLTVGDSGGGSFVLASGMTLTYTGPLTFASTTSGNTIASVGQSLASSMTFSGVGGTWTQVGALLTTGAWTLTNGTYSAGNNNITAASFSSSNTNTRVLTMGFGIWKATGTGTVWTTSTTTGLTLNANNSTIELSDASVTNKTFAGGGATFYNIQLDAGGAGLVIFSGANTFNEIFITAPKSVQFPASTTQTFVEAPEWRGASGSVITVTSSSAGTAATLSSTQVAACDWLSLKDSTATGTGGVWFAGENSTNVSGNSGWSFTAAPVDTRPSLFLGLALGLGMP